MAAEAARADGPRAGSRGAAVRTLTLPALVFAVAAGAASLLFLDLCDLFYDCGCVSLWAGGAAHCNIQTPGPPDCPYCAHPQVAYGALFGTIAAQGAILFLPGFGRARKGGSRNRGRGLLRRTVGAFLAIPSVVGAVAGVLGLFTNYWG